MQANKPFGSDWNFIDLEWLVPLTFVVFAMLFGNFAWVNGTMLVAITIVGAHLWFEIKRNLPRKKQGNWLVYIIGSWIICLVLTPFFMVVLALIAYATILGHLKRGVNAEKVNPRYLKERSLTFQRMSILIIASACVYGVKYISILDNVEAAQQQRLVREGVISAQPQNFNQDQQ